VIFGTRHSDTPDRGWYDIPWWRTVRLEDGRYARRQKVFRVWNQGNWAGGQRWMYFETDAEAPLRWSVAEDRPKVSETAQ
jgi:hypothetical protein